MNNVDERFRRTNRDEYGTDSVYDYIHAKPCFAIITIDHKKIIEGYLDKAPLYCCFDTLMLNIMNELYQYEVDYGKEAGKRK